MYFGGGYYPAYHYGYWSGYSFYWGAPHWYYYTPFHPAFYWHQPMYYGDGYYPGGFNWLNLFIGLIVGPIVVIFVLGLMIRLFSGGRRLTYTNN